MPQDNDEDDLLDDLTPVQRRRLKSSIRINDTPADRIAYQHTVLCQTSRATRYGFGSGGKGWCFFGSMPARCAIREQKVSLM